MKGHIYLSDAELDLHLHTHGFLAAAFQLQHLTKAQAHALHDQCISALAEDRLARPRAR